MEPEEDDNDDEESDNEEDGEGDDKQALAFGSIKGEKDAYTL